MMGRGAEGGCGTEEKPCPVSRASSSALSGPSGRHAAVDLYSQVRKALTERSPFATEEEASRVATLPVSLAASLARHGDGRRKHHKKAHAGEHGKKTHAVGPQAHAVTTVWDETEEYFRSVSLSDVELLVPWVPRLEDECFRIPIRLGVETSVSEGDAVAEMEVEQDELSTVRVEVAAVGFPAGGQPKEAEQQEQEDMDIDEVENEERNDGGAGVALVDDMVEESVSSLNWLLGSKHRVLLTTERPNKKRKLLGSDAGLERLLRLPQPDGDALPLCDYCCNQSDGGKSGSGDFVCCESCKATVHRKCYGVQKGGVGGWICSRCKYLEEVGKPLNGNGESPCLLCPREVGVLKPVEDEGSMDKEKVRFAHLFCSLWMPEMYVERLEAMEPIMNIKGIPGTRRKLVCNVCKVKHGACVRCSNGTCRTSFHPSCARKSKHKMEIWGKVGCDNNCVHFVQSTLTSKKVLFT